MTAWYADECHYNSTKEAIFVGEMMAKEDVNGANGCDGIGTSDANVEYLNGAR